MIDRKELAAQLRQTLRATPPPKEEPEYAIGQMVAAGKRKGGRRKAQRRGK